METLVATIDSPTVSNRRVSGGCWHGNHGACAGSQCECGCHR